MKEWKNLPATLPPFDGEKFNVLLPCVWRRCITRTGFDASLADDDRFRVIGPNSSRFRFVDIALHGQKETHTKTNRKTKKNDETEVYFVQINCIAEHSWIWIARRREIYTRLTTIAVILQSPNDIFFSTYLIIVVCIFCAISGSSVSI